MDVDLLGRRRRSRLQSVLEYHISWNVTSWCVFHRLLSVDSNILTIFFSILLHLYSKIQLMKTTGDRVRMEARRAEGRRKRCIWQRFYRRYWGVRDRLMLTLLQCRRVKLIDRWSTRSLLWGEKGRCEQIWNKPKPTNTNTKSNTNQKQLITLLIVWGGDSGVCTE